MAEIAPAGGGPNRLFLALAIGLAGLLVLGVIGLGGFVLLQNMFRQPTARVAIATVTTTRVLGTPTLAPTVPPTEVPSPTLVVSGGAATATTPAPTVTGTPPTSTPTIIGGGTVTGTPGTGTPTGGELPKTGLGEDLLLLAGGFVLVLVIFAARRARTA